MSFTSDCISDARTSVRSAICSVGSVITVTWVEWWLSGSIISVANVAALSQTIGHPLTGISTL